MINTPLAPITRNPLRLRAKTISPRQQAMPSYYVYRETNFTTTDIVNYVAALDGTIYTELRNGILRVDAQLGIKHSVAGSTCHAEVWLYIGSTPYVLVKANNIYLPSTSAIVPVRLGALVDLALNGFIPGSHRLVVAVKNLVAGTLTVVASTTAECFVTTQEAGAAGRGLNPRL